MATLKLLAPDDGPAGLRATLVDSGLSMGAAVKITRALKREVADAAAAKRKSDQIDEANRDRTAAAMQLQQKNHELLRAVASAARTASCSSLLPTSGSATTSAISSN